MANQQQNSNNERSTHSQSVPPRRSFTERISAVGAKINRALSNDGRADYDAESMTSTVVDVGAGRSRSNDSGYHSSGRGGAGNFYANGNPGATNLETQEFPWPRGRERLPVSRSDNPTTLAAPAVTAPARSTGRGGSGNFSANPPAGDPSYTLRDREILRAHAEAEKTHVRSSGRGGMGNIVHPDAATSNSRSRSRSVDPAAAPTSYQRSSVSRDRTRG
ncbi:hypothetical protein FB45DRAFT_922619 [Roridomyces roridus]|uniref:Uncharacterized protein n=1 Tax=Roridomyces roridus TaxID=1738132 RepID=A0AAD7BN84_9AGAR|nr:hypothetical protein FB45DRAFT_922619 [Roridomyces roridus]